MEKGIYAAALFDLDGVIVDTEGEYSRFWGEQGERFALGGHAFAARIKGSTLKEILETYFPDPAVKTEVSAGLEKFESELSFAYISGFEIFIRRLRASGIKTAIVTSSDDLKMARVYRARPELPGWFDTIVTADKITRSKPDPEPYLKAAQELGISPEKCVVFEDSFAGLESGRRAGMFVTGLATTNPAETLRDKADIVIPDFTGFPEERYRELFG